MQRVLDPNFPKAFVFIQIIAGLEILNKDSQIRNFECRDLTSRHHNSCVLITTAVPTAQSAVKGRHIVLLTITSKPRVAPMKGLRQVMVHSDNNKQSD